MSKNTEDGAGNKLDLLAGGIRRGGGLGPAPPVEEWNPPICRDIGLAITAEGIWQYQGSAIIRPALVRLFASLLRREPEGGYYLVTPVEKVCVAVADAPFLAAAMEVRGEGPTQELVFRTNVDEEVRCGREHPLRFAVDGGASGGVKPYVRVRGRLEARLTRSLTYDLITLALPSSAGNGMAVWSGGAEFVFPDC